MSTKFNPADRLDLPAYPFAEIERKATKIRNSGTPLYDLSIGDPDLPPPKFVTEAIRSSLNLDRTHRYPSTVGDIEVRSSVANWYLKRFGVKIDPASQVCILIGAKEGLAQIAKAVVNPGDVVAVPDPAYPVYSRAGSQFVHASTNLLPLLPENGFLPDYSSLANIDKTKLLYLNYPNNPTGATTNDDFLRITASIADDNPHLTIAYDMAYSEIWFEKPPRSLLEFTPNAIEFHSLSKMANATGYRVGFAVGHPERIAALRRVKEEIDSGAPLPFQYALKALLDSYEENTPPVSVINYKEIVKKRKSVLIEAIQSSGRDVFMSDCTFYIWFESGDEETEFVDLALNHGVLLTPGTGFGKYGKGWVRASVTASDETIVSAADILKQL